MAGYRATHALPIKSSQEGGEERKPAIETALGDVNDLEWDPDPIWSGPQGALWESQFKPEATGDAKAKLLTWYLENLLSKLPKGTVFPVLYFLLKSSPNDLGQFKLSTRRLAKEAGVSPESVRSAVAYLSEKGLIEVKHGLFSVKGPGEAVLPKYRILSLAEIKRANV